MSTLELKNLANIPLPERLEACPSFLEKLFRRLIRDVAPSKIWLFGSRVKGNHRPTSDIDIAVQFHQKFEDHWFQFKSELDEIEETLLDIDWVDFERASDDLKKNIVELGILIYEREK